MALGEERLEPVPLPYDQVADDLMTKRSEGITKTLYLAPGMEMFVMFEDREGVGEDDPPVIRYKVTVDEGESASDVFEHPTSKFSKEEQDAWDEAKAVIKRAIAARNYT
jgi:hypothetical protein